MDARKKPPNPPVDTALAGHVLMAMPGMEDPRFARAVVLIADHGPRGAMGLIVNKPLVDLPFSRLAADLGLDLVPGAPDLPVVYGGPVEPGRGFVLHLAGAAFDGQMEVPGGFVITATRDILERVAAGAGPGPALLALGFAGWAPGQLEGEISRGDWLSVRADAALIFDTSPPAIWAEALARLGVSPRDLSARMGHA